MKGTSITVQWRFEKYHNHETRERWYLRTSGCYVKGIEQAELSETFIISTVKFFFFLFLSSSLFLSFFFYLELRTFLYCLITLYDLSETRCIRIIKRLSRRAKRYLRNSLRIAIYHIFFSDNCRWYTTKNPWACGEEILKNCHDSSTSPSFIFARFRLFRGSELSYEFPISFTVVEKEKFYNTAEKKTLQE